MALEQLRKQIAERRNSLSASGYVPSSTPVPQINLTQSLNLPLQRHSDNSTPSTTKEEPSNSALELLRKQIAIRTSNGVTRPLSAPSSLETQEPVHSSDSPTQIQKPIPPPKPHLASSNSLHASGFALAENSSEDTGKVIRQQSFTGETIAIVVPKKPHNVILDSASSSEGYSSEDAEQAVEEDEEDRPLRSAHSPSAVTKHLPTTAVFSPVPSENNPPPPEEPKVVMTKTESSSFAQQTKIRLLETEINMLKEQLSQAKQSQENYQKQIDVLEKDDTKQKLLHEIDELHLKLEERNKERQHYKEMIQSIRDAETKKQSNISEVIKEMEQRMESQQKRLEEAEEEIRKRTAVEESLKRELEKVQQKLYEDTEDSDSTIEMLYKNLQAEMDKLRKRLEAAIKDKESLETQNAILAQSLEDTKADLESSEKSRESLQRENIKLQLEAGEAKNGLASEQKERKELEQMNVALKDFKMKYQKEWEDKLAMESQCRTLQREMTLLRNKLKKQFEMTEDTEAELFKSSGLISNKSSELRSTASNSPSRPSTPQEKDNKSEEELKLTKKELEAVKQQLATQTHLRESAENQLHEVQKKKRELQRSLKELTDESSLEGQLLKLKRDHASVLEELAQTKEKLKMETRKKNEILLAKVKTDKSFQTLKGKLDLSQSKVASAPSTPMPSPQVSRKVVRSPSMRSDTSTEEVQELLYRLEEQTMVNVTLERENAMLKERGNSFEHEVRMRLKLEEKCRALEVELDKANNLIQFQHQELTSKHKELEESRQGVIQMLMSSQKTALKRQ